MKVTNMITGDRVLITKETKHLGNSKWTKEGIRVTSLKGCKQHEETKVLKTEPKRIQEKDEYGVLYWVDREVKTLEVTHSVKVSDIDAKASFRVFRCKVPICQWNYNPFIKVWTKQLPLKRGNSTNRNAKGIPQTNNK